MKKMPKLLDVSVSHDSLPPPPPLALFPPSPSLSATCFRLQWLCWPAMCGER